MHSFPQEVKKMIGKFKIKMALHIWIKPIFIHFKCNLGIKELHKLLFLYSFKHWHTIHLLQFVLRLAKTSYIFLNSRSSLNMRVYKSPSKLHKIYFIWVRGSARTTARNYLIASSKLYHPVWTAGKKKSLKEMEPLSIFPSLRKKKTTNLSWHNQCFLLPFSDY